MRRHLSLRIIGVAMISLLAAACGGDDDEAGDDQLPAATENETATPADGNAGGELSLQEYFQKTDAIFARSDDDLDNLNTQLQPEIAAGTLEEQKQALQEFLDGSAVVLQDAIDDMEALVEPEEVTDAHEAFIASIGDGLDLTEALRDDIDGVETAEELEALTTQFDNDFAPVTAASDVACLELQGIADDNEIDVDLNCEE